MGRCNGRFWTNKTSRTGRLKSVLLNIDSLCIIIRKQRGSQCSQYSLKSIFLYRVYNPSSFNSSYNLIFQSTPPRGWRQQYYTITTTILHHISTNKSYPTPSNHGQPSLHTRKSVLIVQIFRCESPRKSMFASGSHQNTLYRFTARGQVRISAVLPH